MLLVWDIAAKEIVQVDKNHLGDLQDKNVTIESNWLRAGQGYRGRGGWQWEDNRATWKY